jgi:hypothetical protein
MHHDHHGHEGMSMAMDELISDGRLAAKQAPGRQEKK